MLIGLDFGPQGPVEERSGRLVSLVYGLCMTPLGLLALAIPPTQSPATELMIGSLLFVVGFLGMMVVLESKAPAFWPHLAWAMVALLVSAALILLPQLPTAHLVAATCIAQGAAATAYAVLHRRSRQQGWTAILVAGVCSAGFGSVLAVAPDRLAFLTGPALAVDISSFAVSMALCGRARVIGRNQKLTSLRAVPLGGAHRR
jgi:uncharacterized membrane protein HdeD (DUF308 family)